MQRVLGSGCLLALALALSLAVAAGCDSGSGQDPNVTTGEVHRLDFPPLAVPAGVEDTRCVTVRLGNADAILNDLPSLRQEADYVVADGPGSNTETSRALLLRANLALVPCKASMLEVRALKQATSVLQYAQKINAGRPEGCLVLNKMRTRDVISRDLRAAAPHLGVWVAKSAVRDLQAFRDAPQQRTVVTRMSRRAEPAAHDVAEMFTELLADKLPAVAGRVEITGAANG